MHQVRVSLLESMDYSQWSLDVLRRLAKAFDLRLVVKFEDFGSYLQDYFEFDREHLQRRPFGKDLIFSHHERKQAVTELLMEKKASRKPRKAVAKKDEATTPALFILEDTSNVTDLNAWRKKQTKSNISTQLTPTSKVLSYELTGT